MVMTVEMDDVSFMVKIVRLYDWEVVTCVRRRIISSAPCDTIAQATCKRALLLRSLEEFGTADKHDILRHSRQVRSIERNLPRCSVRDIPGRLKPKWQGLSLRVSRTSRYQEVYDLCPTYMSSLIYDTFASSHKHSIAPTCLFEAWVTRDYTFFSLYCCSLFLWPNDTMEDKKSVRIC